MEKIKQEFSKIILSKRYEKNFTEAQKRKILENKKGLLFLINNYPSYDYKFDHCILCGEETIDFAFCLDCYEALERDDYLCKDIINSKIVENTEKKNKCLICGEDTKEGVFCERCYRENKQKIVFLEISKGKEIKINDSRWANNIKTKDGHYVRSKDERAIADYLFDNKIRYVYEDIIVIDDEKSITPDFYLPDYFDEPVYIEYFGVEGIEKYERIKEEKIKYYKKKKLTLICLDSKDATHMEDTLKRMINKETIKYKEINVARKN